MDSVQLNTRIPCDLKREGDEVLMRLGKSTSEAVRALWAYLVKYQKMPECLVADANDDLSALEEREKLAEAGSHILRDYCMQIGLSVDSICDLGYPGARGAREECDARGDRAGRDEMYAEMLKEYEALDA